MRIHLWYIRGKYFHFISMCKHKKWCETVSKLWRDGLDQLVIDSFWETVLGEFTSWWRASYKRCVNKEDCISPLLALFIHSIEKCFGDVLHSKIENAHWSLSGTFFYCHVAVVVPTAWVWFPAHNWTTGCRTSLVLVLRPDSNGIKPVPCVDQSVGYSNIFMQSMKQTTTTTTARMRRWQALK